VGGQLVEIGQWSGSAATNALDVTIKAFNIQSKKYIKTMTRLTWGMTALTIVVMIGLFAQIWLAP
jgi:hypothetical protein